MRERPAAASVPLEDFEKALRKIDFLERQGRRMWGYIHELQEFLDFDMDNEEPKRPAPELFDYLQRFIKSDEDGK